MKRPAFQFYPADWRKDPALSSCSLAARGLWIELMCIAHECEPYGHVAINGQPMTAAQLARQVGEQPKVVEACLEELEASGVFSRDEKGRIFSRRMVRDERIRNARAAGGKLGGNPALMDSRKDGAEDTGKVEGKVNLPPNHAETLGVTPSSSSSSSTSVTTPLPPSQPSAEGGNAPANGHDLLGEPSGKAKAKRKPVKLPIPQSWSPKPTTIDWVNRFLAEHDLSEDWAQRQHDLFVGKAKANAWTYADWDQAYENFFRENGPGGRFYRDERRTA